MFTEKRLIVMIIIICLILFSCNSINIIGNWSGKRNRNNLDLNLDQDSTYTYCFSNYNEQIRDYSEGKWRKNEKNIIIINSNIQNNIIPLEIFYEKMKKNENQLCISIILKVFNQYPYGSDNEDDYVCEPFTNDTIPLREQLTGEDMFNAMATNSDPYTGRGGSYTIYSDTLINDVWFEISRTFYTGTYFIEQPIRTERKKINCSLGDSIVINININDDLFNYKVFNNKTLKIKNNRIIFYNNNEYNDKIKLKKQNDESW